MKITIKTPLPTSPLRAIARRTIRACVAHAYIDTPIQLDLTLDRDLHIAIEGKPLLASSEPFARIQRAIKKGVAQAHNVTVMVVAPMTQADCARVQSAVRKILPSARVRTYQHGTEAEREHLIRAGSVRLGRRCNGVLIQKDKAIDMIAIERAIADAIE